MKRCEKQAGQAFIEFALVFPLFILMMMGLFDIGRVVFYYATLNTAAREGARFAIVQPDCDYMSNPGDCSGGYLDTYPLNCNSAASTANINICNVIKNKFFNNNFYSSSTIMINHLGTSEDPKIDIGIDFLFKPITPGIAMMGNMTMHVNSQMLMAPVAKP